MPLVKKKSVCFYNGKTSCYKAISCISILGKTKENEEICHDEADD